MVSYCPSSLIPVSSSCLKGNEQKYLLDCLFRNWLTQGYYVRQFEEKMSEWTDRKHAIACSSGTAALHLGVRAYKSRLESNFALLPALTYIASANSINYSDLDFQFVDVQKNSWCIDLSQVDDKVEFWNISDALVLGVDLYDAKCDDYRDEPFAVDASESCVARADLVFSAFSFYGNKLITTGEGGMVLTDDDELAEQVKLYRGQGAVRQGDYYHSVIGYNYRMTDLQAAVGLAQLERVDEFISYRRMIIDRYRDNLRDDDRFTLQGGPRANGWMFALLLPSHYRESDRDRVKEELLSCNIETRSFFRPIPSLPPYFEADWQERYPVSAELYRRGICLPTHVNLSEWHVDYICECLKEIVT